MDKLRVEIKNHLKMQLDQFVQSLEGVINDLFQHLEKQLLLLQQTVTESNEKLSEVKSDMENLRENVEVI